MNPSNESANGTGNESSTRRLEASVQELIARVEADDVTIRRLQEEVAQLRATIQENRTQDGSSSVELANGRFVSRALYEDVRWKLSILLKPHLQIVASKARNPSMVIDEQGHAVHCDVARKYGIGHDFCSHREAFRRLGLIDVEGNMPNEVAAIVTAATELKGTDVALREAATTEEVAATAMRKAETQRREEMVAITWNEEQTRQLARQQELLRRQQQRNEEDEQREQQQVLEVQRTQARLERQLRYQRGRRWIRWKRWIKVQWDELTRT